jgi:hypothetical protein
VSAATLVRTEILKLRTTRLWWGLLIGGVALSGGLAVLVAAVSGQSFGGQPAPGPGLEDPATLRSVYSLGFTNGYVITLSLGILGMAGEYRHQTITPTFLATPLRARVAVAKLVAYLLVGGAYGAAMVAASVLASVPVIALRGYALQLTGPGIPRTLALSVLGCAVWAVVGVGLGTLIRNQVVALVVALGSQLLVEPLVALALNAMKYGGTAAQYLPSQATSSIVAGSNQGVDISLLPWWGGALVLVGYGVLMAALGTVLTLRRDVT